MSFGRNPHVAKAETAEQKAEDATDDIAREQARRDAAHQWERAAGREKPGKVRAAYEANAERNRRIADGQPEAEREAGAEPSSRHVLVLEEAGTSSPHVLVPEEAEAHWPRVLLFEDAEAKPGIALDSAQLN